MAFPPLKASKTPTPGAPYEGASISKGKGGLKNSIKIKNAGIKPSPGVEKDINAF